MSLRQITIHGYKSIEHLDKFELSSLNVLIGANGAGKSNFISIFKLLNEMYEQRLQSFVQKQGGPDSLLHFGRDITDKIHAEFYFYMNGYKFDLVPTVDNRLIFESEYLWFEGVHYSASSHLIGYGKDESELKESKDKYAPYVCSAIKGWRVYHFHDTSDTAKVKRRHAVNDNLLLKPDAENLAAYLRMLSIRYPDEYRRIVETIQIVLPFFKDFVQREDNDIFIELEWFQVDRPDTPLRAHLLSDGSLRFICLTTLLLQPKELLPDTIIIDEPELGLHPYAISVLADIFKQVAEDKQLIISTQSVELINEMEAENIIVVDQEQGKSTFKRFGQEELSEWLDDYSLGELWKRNVLGGRP